VQLPLGVDAAAFGAVCEAAGRSCGAFAADRGRVTVDTPEENDGWQRPTKRWPGAGSPTRPAAGGHVKIA
jgi:hypothetical protein